MYTLERVKKEFAEACNKMNVTVNVPISINSRLTSTLGRVMFQSNAIDCVPLSVEFSKKMIETATDECVANVIKHEAAHYIVLCLTGKDHKHDKIFQSCCHQIGCDFDAPHAKVELVNPDTPRYKYTVTCNTCHKVVGGYTRMCPTLKNLALCTCKTCHTANLSYTQNW